MAMLMSLAMSMSLVMIMSMSSVMTMSTPLAITIDLIVPTQQDRACTICSKQFGVSEMQLHRIKTGENWGYVKEG